MVLSGSGAAETPTLVLTTHLRRLQARIAGRTTESPEALLNDLVPDLIKALAALGGRTAIDLRGQSYEGNIGRPDFSVKDHLLLIGHVETKAPGAGADHRTFKGHDRDQWKRFAKLPNVLYTDGSAFALYRSGDRVGPVLNMTFDLADPQQSADPQEVTALVSLVDQFLAWRVVAPTSLPGLAERLAPLCAVLRDVVRERLDQPNSEVAQAAAEVRQALFADRSDDEVADAFAQLCAYSMLLARSAGADRLTSAEIESALRAGHPVIGRAVRVLLDEDTEEELGWALDTLRTLVEAVDFEKLRPKQLPGLEHQGDTWLYFYEHFLAAYDPVLRDKFGVYYTPPAVISAQVALLDEIVRTRFGRSDGLASNGVTVLDPAAGTGSYALKLIERVATRVDHDRGPGAVPGAVSALARNVYAFEILVGPYAVAHLRISELLQQLGATLPPDGPRVYLADTLDSPYAEPLTISRALAPLAEERRRALRVKREQEILVCLGNPPYERLSADDPVGERRGGWVVHGEEGAKTDTPPIFSAFLDPAKANTAFSHIASLYNLYTYFWRWALWKVFEAPNVDGMSNGAPGVVSYISGSSYLTGPGFLGMREYLRRLCDEVWIIDLGGEGHGARKEDNVFAIQTPVAICLAVRSGASDPGTPATVKYTRISGTRAEKLHALVEIDGLDDLPWQEVSGGWHAPFSPDSGVMWTRWPTLTDLFPWSQPGPMLNRTWPVTVDEATARKRWRRLAAAPENEKGVLFADSKFGRNSKTEPKPAWPPPASMQPIRDVTENSPEPPILGYGMRSFDQQSIVADARVMRTPSQPLWWAQSDQQIYLASMLTDRLGPGPAATLSVGVPDKHYFSGRGGKDIVPLYRDPVGTPNGVAGLTSTLGTLLGVEVTAEDLFAYVYAVLSTPSYIERFYDELERPGARIPITRDPALFEQAVKRGRKLIALHTNNQRFAAEGDEIPRGKARITKPIGPEMPIEIAYDAESKQLRVGSGIVAPVEPAVWEFSVSGLQVVRSWLRYRLREPTGRAKSSKSPLDRIRPTQWTGQFDTALLSLLWTLEATVEQAAAHTALLAAICDGDTIEGVELPLPSAHEHEPPTLPQPKSDGAQTTIDDPAV